MVAPVRGQIQLMDQALHAYEERAIAAGELDKGNATADSADVGGWHPRYSPLYRNWLYAWHSVAGGFEDEDGVPRDGGTNTVQAVYGVVASSPKDAFAPPRILCDLTPCTRRPPARGHTTWNLAVWKTRCYTRAPSACCPCRLVARPQMGEMNLSRRWLLTTW